MPPKKRGLDEAQLGSRRRSTRLSSVKSSYFENEDDVDDSGPPPHKKTAVDTSRSRRTSQVAVSDDDDQYEEDDMDDEDDEEGDGDGDDVDREDSTTPPPKSKSSTAKRGRGRPPNNSSTRPKTTKSQAKVLNSARSSSGTKTRGRPANVKQASPSATRGGRGARDGDKDEEDEPEEDDDSDEPQVTFIPLPKLRDANGVDYEDAKIHPNTLLFLGDLKANNKRSWLKMHDPEFRRSLKDWESFVETLTPKIILADDTIPELPTKDVVFRIYRDIRFSKDKIPYKPHYSAAWSRTGRKGPYACYYVHIEPGHCFVGGGLWQPGNLALDKLRASIDEDPQRIRRVLTDTEFVRVFFPHVIGKKEDQILKAFVDKNQENALKTKPKGVNADHRDIQLMRLRNYTIGRQIPDEDLFGDDLQDKIMGIIEAMVPFVTFLNDVVMPDPSMDSDIDGE